MRYLFFVCWACVTVLGADQLWNAIDKGSLRSLLFAAFYGAAFLYNCFVFKRIRQHRRLRAFLMSFSFEDDRRDADGFGPPGFPKDKEEQQ